MSATLQNTISTNWESHRSGKDSEMAKHNPFISQIRELFISFYFCAVCQNPSCAFQHWAWAAHRLCLECEWVIRKSLSLESGRDTGAVYMGIKRPDYAFSGKASWPTIIPGPPLSSEPGVRPPGMITKAVEGKQPCP